MSSESPSFITPPHSLAEKVPKRRQGGVDEDAIARAEAALAALSGDYLKWATADLARLENLTQSLARDPQRHAAIYPTLFRTAHDMKGQGGSFNYGLVTQIGNRLCRYVERVDDHAPTAEELEIIEVHLRALRVVLTDELQGSGGEVGQALITGLERVMEKYGA